MKLRIPFRPGKSLLLFGVAIAVGLLAAFAARNYLAARVADLESRASTKMVSVIVAKQDLQPGTRLSNANLAIRQIPEPHVHGSAIVPERLEKLDGQSLAHAVRAGDAVFVSMLQAKKPQTFSEQVPSGRRALTVHVDEINSLSGMLEPGDLVDIVVSLDAQGKRKTVPLLQAVRVLATGQRTSEDPKSGEKRTYSTVTLDTDLRQAQAVIVARESGRLTALLRNPTDPRTAGLGETDLATLFGSNQPIGAGSRDIPVLYGGRGGKLSGDAVALVKNTATAEAAAPAAAQGNAR